MRSRSSRFFVILLHLVGCPRHFRNTLDGIIGVQPWPIVLQTLSLDGSDQKEQESSNTAEPIWLQDEASQTCLGPQGKFTPDCGDATLWLALPQTTLRIPPKECQRLKRRRARMGLWGVDEDEQPPSASEHQHQQQQQHASHGWVFYLVDRDVEEILQATAPPARRQWWKFWQKTLQQQQRHTKKKQTKLLAPLECLVYDPHSGNMAVQQCDHALHQIPQHSALPTWGWTIDSVTASLQPAMNIARDSPPRCAAIQSGTHRVRLDECEDSNPSLSSGQVQLSLVRYRAVAAMPESKVLGHKEHAMASVTTTASPSTSNSAQSTDSLDRKTEAESHLPSLRDLAHKTALGTAMHTQELTLPSARLLFEKRPPRDKDAKPKRSSKLLQKSNPFLLAGGSIKIRQPSSPFEEASPAVEGSSPSSSVHQRNRRIPTHPYIAAAKDEVWTDPQTGLEYFTDLSGYLGHDRQERGRHTLMGVGQYRKGYVIKVYGIAYYVSKRDVLADPFFEKYADMPTQELQSHPEFYDHLRLHPENFERTIFIKTNMQLSAETIRGSLKADWSMLTDEAKDTILESSMKPQPMNDRTMEIITDPGNPGRCSCMSQVPDHLNADPSCCARGTELVFTWLKNGDIECRLNGRVVEVFPRPDIAQGIFFEYLRNDDPISPELKDNVVDGFPFLLAPLAQVKGVHIGQSTASGEVKKYPSNPLIRAFSELADAVGSNAAGMASAMQQTASDASSNAQRAFGDATRSMGDAARHVRDSAQDLGREFHRRREDLAKRAESFPDALTKLRKDPIQAMKDWLPKDHRNDGVLIPGTAEEESEAPELRLSSTGRLFGYPLSRWFGNVYYAPDEIGPMIIHPTMDMTRKIFLFLVHLYLLLLFIVSFPGSYTTRTKLIRRQSKIKARGIPSDTESESDEDEPNNGPFCKENRIRSSQFFSRRLSGGGKISASSHCNGKKHSKATIGVSSFDESESSPAALSPPLKQKSLSYYL